jgi:hypothetical protein
MSTWPAIESDLRKALLAADTTEHVIDIALAALQPIVVAVEKAGTRIDIELAWALLAVQADRQRRAALNARSRARRTA